MTGKENLLDLSGKVAVVTGGGDGIGRSCCEILASAGASVAVCDLNGEKAAAVARELTDSYGVGAIGAACDVTDDKARTDLVARTVAELGGVNILVNNVGRGGGGRENLFKIDVDYVERIYRLNVFAPWRLCQLAAPEMQRSGYGSIINITSISSVAAEADMAIYASSKAALNHLSANLAYDLGVPGVRINCVGPGATMTPALASVLTPDIRERMLRRTPLKRLGEASDIAMAVLFFASPMSAWISGQTLLVDGGGIQTLS